MRSHVRILSTYSWQLALIVNDWIFVIVRWMSNLTYDVVEQSTYNKTNLYSKVFSFARRPTHTK